MEQKNGTIQTLYIFNRAVPDFGSGSGWNPALFPNPAEMRLWQKSHQSWIVLPDFKSRYETQFGILDVNDVTVTAAQKK